MSDEMKIGYKIDRLWDMERSLEALENQLKNTSLYQAIQEAKENIEDAKQELLRDYDEAELSSAAGQHGKVSIRRTETWTPVDWDAFCSYVALHDAWDLIHKRVTTTAVRARQSEGVEVPGVQKFVKRTISVKDK